MRIAFYAPLKPPDHPIPSGDRQVAQLLLAALRLAGHDPVLVSRFRSYDGYGDARRQARLAALAERIVNRLLRHCREFREHSPELWFSYHVYHKAPDWLGPAVTCALGIPYVIAEASVTPIQRCGPWAHGHRATENAIKRADAVIGLNGKDRECVLPLLREPWRWFALKPFVDAKNYRRKVETEEHPARLITVAMMRYGDKLVSYRLLADSLSRLLDLPWTLEIVGDGPARRDVENALAPLNERVSWMGSLDHDAIAGRLALADVCVWPAFNEAFGMALLEAQASGLAVVAGASGGVGEIIEPEVTGLLVAPGDARAFAAAVRSVILNYDRRQALAEAARQRILLEHDLRAATRRLAAVIDAVDRACAA
jgi:glycosyltransferase involved in cell wall biosynthesis